LRNTLLRGIATNAFLGSTIILLLLFLARGPRRDFGDVLQALESLRTGETPQHVAGLSRRDEVGRLAATVDSFREAIVQRRAAETAQQQLQLELQQARERAAQEALDRSREQYRLVVENVAEGILVVQEGRVVLANPPVCSLVGENVETLRARPFLDFVHPDDRAMVMDRHVRRMRGETIEPRYSFRIVDRHGRAVPHGRAADGGSNLGPPGKGRSRSPSHRRS
jgi:PAS domain S-box-containing protein